MKYKTINGIDKKLSLLTYGTPGAAFSKANRESAFNSYNAAWDAGFRTFDTAHSYGDGEDILGQWLNVSRHRNEAVILDKGCNPGQKGSPDVMSADTIRDQLEESLKRLRTDHVEMYVLHRDDPSVPVGEIIDVLNTLKEEGKLLIFGVSNWQLKRILEAELYAQKRGLSSFSVVSPAYSLADYISDPWGGSVALSGNDSVEYRNWLVENQMPVFCYSSLGRGYLSGKFRTDANKPIEECIAPAPITEYDAPVNRDRLARAEKLAAEKNCTVSQICLAWLLRQPQFLLPIISPSSKEHIRDNVGSLDISLTTEECAWLLGKE